MTRVLAVLFLFLTPALVGAQVVRGDVVEQVSGMAVAGVLVSLETADGSTIMSSLTRSRGEFTMVAPAAGRYRLTAKRIGVKPYRTDWFEVQPGEAHIMHLVVEPLAYRLPDVVVLDSRLCVKEESRRAEVIALWEEARTALEATRVSMRDRLVEGELQRYVRSLDARSRRVLDESWSDVRGILDRPLGVLEGDSLSIAGFWRVVGEQAYYFAPDADVLLSPAFVRDHCFAPDRSRTRHGEIGVSFEPVDGRAVPDVLGTVWMDRRSFELRRVEFQYTHVEPFRGSDQVGGELYFRRLEDGAWLMDRWSVRVPPDARLVTPMEADGRRPAILIRPTSATIIETGGMVKNPRPRGIP